MQSNLPYLITQTFKGMKRNRLILLPAGVTLFLCSLLFMISLGLLQGIYHLDTDSDEVWKLRIFLTGGLDSTAVERVGLALAGALGVERTEWIDPEKAKARFVERFGEEWFNPLDKNPLPGSWEVWPQPSFRNSYRLDQLAQNFTQIDGVEEVITSSESLRLLEGKKWQVILGSTAVGLLLLGTLWLILRNSVRLSLLSRRLLVENMKYMGASQNFILFPFIAEALFLSLLSCGLAIIAWWPVYWGVQSVAPFFVLTRGQVLWVQLPVLLLVSVMAVNGTIKTVKQFIWQKES